MKRTSYLIISVLFCLLFASCHNSFNLRGHSNKHIVNPKGIVTTRTIKVSDFNSIRTLNGVTVVLTEGEKGSVLVEADENYQTHIDVRVNGGELTVGLKPDFSYRNGHIKVYVPAAGVNVFKASSSADIIAETPIVSPQITIDLSSSSKMIAVVESGKVIIKAGSSADLTLSGNADIVEIDASSSADVNCDKLIAKRVFCDASSSSDVFVFANDELRIDASSSSNVSYS
ncbi:MAG: head GIN domain-containing protein, partial [Rikenellaceae bacterium]